MSYGVPAEWVPDVQAATEDTLLDLTENQLFRNNLSALVKLSLLNLTSYQIEKIVSDSDLMKALPTIGWRPPAEVMARCAIPRMSGHATMTAMESVKCIATQWKEYGQMNFHAPRASQAQNLIIIFP